MSQYEKTKKTELIEIQSDVSDIKTAASSPLPQPSLEHPRTFFLETLNNLISFPKRQEKTDNL